LAQPDGPGACSNTARPRAEIDRCSERVLAASNAGALDGFMPSELTPELQKFIEREIDSVAHLEALLLVRADASRAWSADEVARSLYLSPEVCTALLRELVSHGFLAATDGGEVRFRYQPASQETEPLVHDLAELYRERRVTIVTLIYSKPISRVQTFADAFRLRGTD
jgi:hypothetical protein